MNWAKRLKRVFGVEIEGCARCGGKPRIIASIEEPAVIARILAELDPRPADRQASDRSVDDWVHQADACLDPRVAAPDWRPLSSRSRRVED